MLQKQLELQQALLQYAALNRLLVVKNRQLLEGNEEARLQICELIGQIAEQGNRIEVLSEELARAYESKEAVSEQQKRDIADLTMRNLRLEREGNRATEEDRRDAAKWRAFKEEEELEVLELCHESRADSIPGSLLPTVDDVQVCPECGGEHLIARHSDVFGCPHCGGEFKLSFVSS